MSESHGDPQHDRLLAMRFVAEAGEMMLESSTSVSEVVGRLVQFCPSVGLPACSIDATLSSIVLSDWPDSQREPLTYMREIQIAEPRLERLSETTALLDMVEAGTLDLESAWEQLRILKTKEAASVRGARIAILVSVAGWVVFLNGLDLLTIFVALLATLMVFPIDSLVRRFQLPTISGTFIAALILAAVPNILAAAGLSFAVAAAMVGGLFVFLPGRALVSSVIDWLANSPVSAMARAGEALLTAGTLALGVLVGGKVGAGLGVDANVEPLTSSVALSIAAAGVGVLGIAVAWGMPRDRLVPTVAIASFGWFIVQLTGSSATNSAWTSYLLAAVVVSFLGVVVASIQGGSASVYTGVAILPLVPGYGLYQGMLAIALGQPSDSLASALKISLAIAGGVSLGLAIGRNLYTASSSIGRRRTRSSTS